MAWGKKRARKASSGGWAKKPSKPRSQKKKWGQMFSDLREWIFTIRSRRLLRKMEKELGMHPDECLCQECIVSEVSEEYSYVGQVNNL